MLRATLKGLAAHKLRMSLTALAIVLGVGFVAGTFVLTDTINKTFNAQGGQTRAPMPASVLDQVKGVDGVAAAEGSVNGYAQFIGKNGKPVTTGGAPTLG